jgi:hypothetical protein
MEQVEWQYERDGVWIPIREDMERLYQEHLAGESVWGRVLHCFGDGLSTGIDFHAMMTHCLSSHKRYVGDKVYLDRCPRGHNVFRIRRGGPQRTNS